MTDAECLLETIRKTASVADARPYLDAYVRMKQAEALRWAGTLTNMNLFLTPFATLVERGDMRVKP